MFKHVVGSRKRAWSATTVAVSVGAHLLLAGGVVFAGTGDPEPPTTEEPPVVWIDTDPAPPPPPPPPPVLVDPDEPPPSATPDAPEPVPGDFVSPRPPEDVPDDIPPVDPDATPLVPADVEPVGNEGDYVLPGAGPGTTKPTGNPIPSGNGEEGVVPLEMVSERPALRNRSEAERVLRSLYPQVLRDAGMTGRTLVMLTIDEEGRAVPGSATVQESSHPSFRDPALRAVERFRFNPARLNGRPVSVIIVIPIDWKVER